MISQTQIHNRFVALARFFVESYNPQPNNQAGVLDIILSLPPEYIPVEPAGRYFAYDFCRAAVACIENQQNPEKWISNPLVSHWIETWVRENIPAKSK